MTKRTASVFVCIYRNQLNTPPLLLAEAVDRLPHGRGSETVSDAMRYGTKAQLFLTLCLVAAMSKKNIGSSIDDFMKEEGIFEEAQNQAIKEVVAWQLAQAMKEKKISKNRMALLLKTSRTQVDRLLDAKNDITLSSLERAAALVGRRVMIQLV